MEFSGLVDILNINKSKNFVDRIINKDKYPVLDLGGGKTATHKMSWGTADGKNVVFPTVLYENGALNQYDPNEAFSKAIESGEFIEFDSPDEADWFSKNYKQYWDKSMLDQINKMNEVVK